MKRSGCSEKACPPLALLFAPPLMVIVSRNESGPACSECSGLVSMGRVAFGDAVGLPIP